MFSILFNFYIYLIQIKNRPFYIQLKNMSSNNEQREDRVWLYFDSNQRTAGTNENYTVTLTNPIPRVRRIRVTDVQIPFTFYTINANNNQLDFNDNTTTLQSAIIAPGNYTADELRLEMQTQMNLLFAGFTITYDSKTLKYNWANAANFEMLVSGTLDPFVGILVDSGVTTDFTGQGAIDIGGSNYLFIKSNKLVRPKIYKPVDNIVTDNILYKVPIATGPGTIISDKNVENGFALKYGANQILDTIDFTLEDPDGNIVDLNGVNWSMTIIAETN